MYKPEPDSDLMPCRESMLEDENVRLRLEVEALQKRVAELEAGVHAYTSRAADAQRAAVERNQRLQQQYGEACAAAGDLHRYDQPIRLGPGPLGGGYATAFAFSLRDPTGRS